MGKQNTNVVILTGNLTRDPEIRFTSNGTAVCNFSLASNRQVEKDGKWVEDPCFVDLTMWGKRAEAFAKYHTKGSPVLVTGRLSYESWVDKQTGTKRSRLKVTAEHWEFQSSPSGSKTVEDGPAPTQEAIEETPF